MTSHQLAKLLLEWPDLPIATYAHGYTYLSAFDRSSHGPLQAGIASCSGVDHLIIGDISKRNINGKNCHVTEMLLGDAPEEWGEWRKS